MPPRQLAREAAWRGARRAIRLAADRRDLTRPLRAPPPSPFSPFLLTGRRDSPQSRWVSTYARAACLSEAEAALCGSFEILGFGRLDFGWEPRWTLDPVSGVEWPMAHHRDAGAMRPPSADIKVPWEASRFHWLVALARAHAYTGDPRFLDGAIRLLDHWREHNPRGWGVNWSNAMEVGIRALNLVWAAEISGDQRLSERVGGLLPSHGRYILENIEYTPRLTSNHYLADLVGLLYIGGALRHRVGPRWWMHFAHHALQREVLKQFRTDGMAHEASAGYHRLSTELVLLGLLAASRLRLRTRARVLDRFGRALEAVTVLTKPNGRLAAIGDEDSGMAVNLASGRDPRNPGPIVGAGQGVLGLSAPGDREDEFQRWAIGRSLAPPNRRGPQALPASGLYLLANDRLWCLVDCGDVGQNGQGGHAHNDTLSFVLAAGKEDLIDDRGTYTYTGDPSARNRFRATRSHATVEIDDQEINRIPANGLFRMHSDDDPVVERFEVMDARQRLVARHHGYRRLADPVTLRRSFELEGAQLLVRDELMCAKRHKAVVTLPLGGGARPRRVEGGWVIESEGAAALITQIEGPGLPLEPVDLPISRRYGSLEPGQALRASIDADGPVSWGLRVSLVERSAAPAERCPRALGR